MAIDEAVLGGELHQLVDQVQPRRVGRADHIHHRARGDPEGLAAVGRMGPDERVPDVRVLILDLLAHFLAPELPVPHEVRIAVVQDEALELDLALGRQRVPGRAEVRKQGVGALGWHFHGIEQGAHHRFGRVGAVGVPADAVIVGADRAAIHDVVRKHIDVGIARKGELLERMLLRLSEPPDEGQQIVRRHGLVAKDDGAVPVEGVHHLVERSLVGRGQVHAQDLGPEAGLELGDTRFQGGVHGRLRARLQWFRPEAPTIEAGSNRLAPV